VELTALSPRSGRAIATYFNFYVLRGNAVRFFQKWRKYYTHFAVNAASNHKRFLKIS